MSKGFPYRTLEVLGEGSYGIVLLVEHVGLNKKFVVKLIQQRFAKNQDAVRRFIAEARRGAKLNHEAFAPIVDLGELPNGQTYFVMEWVEGQTFQQALEERGSFGIQESLTLACDLLEGLAVAHDAFLIHRDLKPANLFLTRHGKVKILDLGISKSILDAGITGHQTGYQIDQQTDHQTAHGMSMGTPRYMSPEQALGIAVSFSSDIYAMGLVLFEMMTGMHVFTASDAMAMLRHHIHSVPPSMSSRSGRTFPPEVERIVARALEKEPEKRFQTVREMARAIRELLPHVPLATPPARMSLFPDMKSFPKMAAVQAPVLPNTTTQEDPTIREAIREDISESPSVAKFRALTSMPIVVATITAGFSIVLVNVVSKIASMTSDERSSNTTQDASVETPLGDTSEIASPIASVESLDHYQTAIDALRANKLELATSEAALAVAQGGGVKARLLLAEIYERRGKTKDARDLYLEILETNSQMAAAYAGLKRCGG